MKWWLNIIVGCGYMMEKKENKSSRKLELQDPSYLDCYTNEVILTYDRNLWLIV